MANIGVKEKNFLETLPIVKNKKGQILFFQGESPQYGYIIKSGTIKTYDISNEGYEQLLYFNTARDVIPFPWITNRVSVSLYFYKSLTSCELYRITKDEYARFVLQDESNLVREIEKFAEKEISNSMRLASVLHSNATNKLVNLLYYLVKDYGIGIGKNLSRINLILTQQDLADLTGVRRETITAEMNKLKRKGIIHYKRRGSYLIDMGQLQKFVGTDFIGLESS